ncbi:cyclic nucleotide-binding domain-containing protein, partial [Candidatus Fermentibacterales bacterium]|nr:cyclic nucleotide-binding domain-containing protein [Candidatus Fermentibacterales bacterium]
MSPASIFDEANILDDPDVEQVLTRTSVSNGTVLARQGKKGNEMYIVTKGRFSVIDEKADNFVITMLGPGEIFGEMSFLAESPRSATVVATEDGEVLSLSRKALPGLLKKSPSKVAHLASGLCQLMAERLREADDIQSLILTDEELGVSDEIAALYGRHQSWKKAPIRLLDEPGILETCQAINTTAHQVLVEQWERSTDLFVVQSGKVNVTDDRSGGFLITSFEPGEVFGEISFIDGRPRSATVSVAEPGEVLFLSRDAVTGLMDRDPALAANLMIVIGQLLA